jgi:hypothetical protein
MADYDIINEELVQGKDVDLTYYVTRNGGEYPLTGKQLDMKVVDEHGTVVKTWSTTGTAAITIAVNAINILDTTGFVDWGFFRGELINNTDDETLAFFEFAVEKQITAP